MTPSSVFIRVHLWLILSALYAANLEISRPARPWEFLDATGEKASILGSEDGTLEGYVYPLKIFKTLRLRFLVDGRVIPGESASRRIIATPGTYTIAYTGDEFEVRETLITPARDSGAIIRLAITAYQPVRIDVEFARDFQMMWPASIGTSYSEWNEQNHGFTFGADGYPYAAFLGAPGSTLDDREYQSNYHWATANHFSLGTVTGRAERLIAFAGSMKSRDEALATYNRLIADPSKVEQDTEAFYRAYLETGVHVELPDPELQQAYDWSRLSMRAGVVDNPFLGKGLVAGYGPSKGIYRPGFAWFFGRDSFWTSFALDSAGDFENARAAIAFIARFQRADGKIPHEIAQSAAQVDWFKQFPYAYASADATPLFIVAIRDYVESSGDVAFASEMWPNLTKALAFMRSTLDEDGFPKNFQTGHGWVEGGPLLPVRVEFYQAGAYVESLRALSKLANLTGDAALSTSLEQSYKDARSKLDARFWLPQANQFAFAIGNDSKPVEEATVLTTVPMWFDVVNEKHAQTMIERLSSEDHESDWGMRIISSSSKTYGPAGYHFGSVWPLFTGWASVGEYREHMAAPAYANLRANAWLALDGAGGNTTEVLSGATYSPLTTASPHQIWSAAMVVSPILRGLFGLQVDATHNAIVVAPHLPAGWNRAKVSSVPFGDGNADFEIEQDRAAMTLKIQNHGSKPIDLTFSPAYAPSARVTKASVNGKPTPFTEQKHEVDWHPLLRASAEPGLTTIRLEHQGTFAYSVPLEPPHLGEPSFALKVISERWSPTRGAVDITVSGRHGRSYSLDIYKGGQKESVPVAIPTGDPASYGSTTLRVPVAGRP